MARPCTIHGGGGVRSFLRGSPVRVLGVRVGGTPVEDLSPFEGRSLDYSVADHVRSLYGACTAEIVEVDLSTGERLSYLVDRGVGSAICIGRR